MALPELTDAELAESRKLLLRFCPYPAARPPRFGGRPRTETMLSAYRAAGGFKGDAQVSSWLFAILKTKLPTACAKSDGNAKFFITRDEEALDEAFEGHFAADGHWTDEGQPSGLGLARSQFEQ